MMWHSPADSESGNLAWEGNIRATSAADCAAHPARCRAERRAARIQMSSFPVSRAKWKRRVDRPPAAFNGGKGMKKMPFLLVLEGRGWRIEIRRNRR